MEFICHPAYDIHLNRFKGYKLFRGGPAMELDMSNAIERLHLLTVREAADYLRVAEMG